MQKNITIKVLSIFNLLKNLLFRTNNAIVSPKAIRWEVWTAVISRQLLWDTNNLSFPNHYEVRFDGQSWDRYYGKRINDTQLRITKMVNEIIVELGGKPDSTIDVTLIPDEALPAHSVKIESSYRTVGGAAVQAYKIFEKHPSVTETDSSGDPVEMSHATRSLKQESACTSVISRTKTAPYNKVACLESSLFNTPVRIENGSIIGVSRYPDTPLPDIELPDIPSLSHVSHRHAAFCMSGDGSWYISSFGQNGTALIRNGTEITVESDAPYRLNSGDSIILGGDNDSTIIIHIGRHAKAKLASVKEFS